MQIVAECFHFPTLDKINSMSCENIKIIINSRHESSNTVLSNILNSWYLQQELSNQTSND